jgi:hypothetical protein
MYDTRSRHDITVYHTSAHIHCLGQSYVTCLQRITEGSQSTSTCPSCKSASVHRSPLIADYCHPPFICCCTRYSISHQSSEINFIARLNDSPVLCCVEIWLNLLFVTANSHSDGTKDKNEACHQWHAATVLASSSYF